MVYPPQLLDRLQAVEPQPWEGDAFRHMFADYPPDRENTRGARWNPPDVAAIYMSLTREGALAEAEHQIAIQPVRPSARRTLYEVRLTAGAVLDLTDLDLLGDLGVGRGELESDDLSACRQVGGAAAWLGSDAILVPSARASAVNLVLFPANLEPDARFDVAGKEAVPSE